MAKRENRTTLGIPVEIKRKARARAIAEGTTLTAVVISLLQMWLNNEVDPPKLEKPPRKYRKKSIE